MPGLALCWLGIVSPMTFALDSAASIAGALRQLSIDPSQTFHVRELQIARGDIKVYLTEGVLAFTKPIGNRTVAAVFTTANTEAGDAEVLVLPTNRSERASLARFTKTPNLEEHFDSAVFFFSDDTAKELRAQIEERPVHPASPEDAKLISDSADTALRSGARQLDVKLTHSLLDSHSAINGFFYAIVGGRERGFFDVAYEPERFEPVALGRIVPLESGGQYFQIWTSFLPRHSPPTPNTEPSISGYRIDAVIHPDLSMSAQADFQYRASRADGRTIALDLSSRLRLASAKIDGQPAEIFQHDWEGEQRLRGPAPMLVVAAEPLTPDVAHAVELTYTGSVVRRTASGSYFVDERTSWYPYVSPMLATFDLTFHCPENLRLVASGELLSDEVAAGVRTVHRKTQIPEPLAGFNLGSYEASASEHGPYRIELFANQLENSAALPAQAAGVLDYYTARWQPLRIHSIAISPIEGYFGQGFPGLIYLSSISYLREQDRPSQLRNPELDSFFSEMLLPHEIAHQWWGSMVSQADYRSAWLFEAMSNYAALEFLEQTKGRAAVNTVLERYRQDLLSLDGGKVVESAGPVDFGERLLDNDGLRPWHVITYEKGAWILHMLHERLGDEAFHTLQLRLLTDFKNKLVANDDFRKLAASLQPTSQTDPNLSLFFENWVYATGIPKLNLKGAGRSLSLKVSAVDDGFAFDLPLRCLDASGKEQTEWVRATAGENVYQLPTGRRSCQLPKQSDYLYQLAN